MIDLKEALDKVMTNTPLLPSITISISESTGYVLAEDVHTEEPVPLFDSSAMDGYAVLMRDVEKASSETPALLKIQGEVRPGTPSLPTLREGHALRIFTGSPIPGNVDAVVMREQVDDCDDTIRVKYKPLQGEHIRRQGGEYQRGEKIFSPGILLTPPVVGMLAVVGKSEVKVYRKPVVAIVQTGDEVKPPSAEIGPGEIRDANSFSLAAALQAMGMSPPLKIHTRDHEKETQSSFSKALEAADVVLSVGGVSVGDYDFVKSALRNLGVETIFWRIAIKPGKPNYFGKKGKKLIFGLPGNPVSVLVSFYLLVRPALRKLQGMKEKSPPVLKARLESDLVKKDPRMEFLRGQWFTDRNGEFFVKPIEGRESHFLGSLASANCLICFPKDRNRIPRGEAVEIEPLAWSDL